jgi:hypothetical protein
LHCTQLIQPFFLMDPFRSVSFLVLFFCINIWQGFIFYPFSCLCALLSFFSIVVFRAEQLLLYDSLMSFLVPNPDCSSVKNFYTPFD